MALWHAQCRGRSASAGAGPNLARTGAGVVRTLWSTPSRLALEKVRRLRPMPPPRGQTLGMVSSRSDDPSGVADLERLHRLPPFLIAEVDRQASGADEDARLHPNGYVGAVALRSLMARSGHALTQSPQA
jgi:hypothetical protein